MATCLVTGGSGFLGSHLCEFLIGKGYRVVCVDNLETASLQNVAHLRTPEFVFVNHDVTQHLAEVMMNRSVRAALAGRNVNEL